MKSVSRKYIISAIGIIAALVICYVASSFFQAGRIVLPSSGGQINYSAEETELYHSDLKDLKMEGDVFLSTSKDPFITVSFSEPVELSEILMDISVKDDDNNTLCQIFYKEQDGSFSEQNSTRLTVSNGEYSFVIPENQYAALRLDITNEEGTQVTLNSVKFGRKTENIVPVFVVSVIFLALFAGLFILIRKGILGAGKASQAGLFLAIVFTAALVFAKMIADGNVYIYSDIGSDTINQYFPSYLYDIEQITNVNTDTWSAEYSMGENSLVFTSLDPVLAVMLFICAAVGKSFLPAALIIHKLVFLLLSGAFCYKFLSLFSEKCHLVALVSYLYAFNGFADIWGQHYFFVSYPVYLIIVLYFLEKYLRTPDKKFSLSLIIVSFLCMALSIYMTYMIYLTAAVYAIIRYVMLAKTKSVKTFVVRFANMAANILIGFGAGLLITIQSVSKILGSGRIRSQSFVEAILDMLQNNFFETWWVPFQRLVSGNLSGIGSSFDKTIGGDLYPSTVLNYYEFPQLFFSVIIIVVAFQFLFTIHKTFDSTKKKVCAYISSALVFLALYTGIVPYILYALSQFNFRCLFVLFPFLALMTLTVLENIFCRKIFSVPGMVIGGVLSVTALFSPFVFINENSVTAAVIYQVVIDIVLLTVGMLVLCCIASDTTKKKNSIMFVVLSGVIFTNCVIENSLSINRNGLISEDTLDSMNRSSAVTESALDHIHQIDDTYYRIEKTYFDHNMFTDSLAQDYKSLTDYDSARSTDMKEFFANYMNPKYSYSGTKRWFRGSTNDLVQYSLLGLKYIISHYEPQDMEHYEEVYNSDGTAVYRNKAVNSFTTFYTQAVPESEFNELNYIDRTKVLQTAVVLSDADAENSGFCVSAAKAIESVGETDITSAALVDISQALAADYISRLEIPLADSWSEGIEDEVFVELSVIPNNNSDLCMYYDTGSGYSTTYRNIMKMNSGQTMTLRYPLPKSTKVIRLDFPEAGTRLESLRITTTKASLKPQGSPSVIKDNGKDSELSVDITCEQDGIMFIPVPNTSGWNITVDGNSADIIPANSAFMAVKLTKGDHTVRVTYSSLIQTRGVYIFIASVIVGVVYWFFVEKKYLAVQKLLKARNAPHSADK